MGASEHGHQPSDRDIYAASDERPPWVEEATDRMWWDVAFGSYGDGYLEWVNDRYFWSEDDPRSLTDSRNLWGHRRRYLTADAGLDEEPRTPRRRARSRHREAMH